MAPRRKILFLDDDEEYMEPLSELLDSEGYQILKAFTIDEAEQILNEAWVHMVIVDLSMTDEEENRDGLVIVNNPKYAAIPKVILTGFGNDPVLVRNTLRSTPDTPPPVVDFIGKDNSGVDRILVDAFETNVRINWDLQTLWGSTALGSLIGLVGLIVPDNDRSHLAHRIDELEDLLRQIFLDSQQIIIGRLLSYEAGIAWLEILAQGEHGTEKQCIVVCGQKDLIQQQELQYEKFVPQATTIGNMRPIETVETLRFGAIAYECISGTLTEMRSLQDLYLRCSLQDGVEILNHLFGSMLSSWHGQRRLTRDTATLKQFYQAWTEGHQPQLEPEEWSAKVAAICNHAAAVRGLSRIEYSAEQLTLYLSETGVESYINPLHFLHEQGAALNTSVVFGTIHGRLHLDAILVDANEHTTWLIDFSQIQIGPILHDFVGLETDLKRELLTMVSIESWCKIEKRLLAVSSLREPIAMDEFSPEVKKILKLICVIREQASIAVTEDLKNYLAGLFVYSITQLATYDTEKTYIGRDLAPYLLHLITAAMVCQHLTSPRQFEPDFDNAFVIVEGEKKTGLAKQEWKILKYLHDRADHLCKFDDILKNVYEDALDDITNGAWMKGSGRPKVNAAIGRLRKKLEPNPQNPRYILTEREHGYRLQL